MVSHLVHVSSHGLGSVSLRAMISSIKDTSRVCGLSFYPLLPPLGGSCPNTEPRSEVLGVSTSPTRYLKLVLPHRETHSEVLKSVLPQEEA